MTQEEVGKLTLLELESIAERLQNAVATFREARALLGGGAAGVGAAAPDAAPPSDSGRAPPAMARTDWTAEEAARRASLLSQFPGDVLEAASRG